MAETAEEVKAALRPEDKLAVDQFEALLNKDPDAYMRPNEIVYSVTLTELLEFVRQQRAPLVTMCEKLEKAPRIGIKDGQTAFKVDYDEVDALIGQARKAHGIPHVPVPAKWNTSLFTKTYLGPLRSTPHQPNTVTE